MTGTAWAFSSHIRVIRVQKSLKLAAFHLGMATVYSGPRGYESCIDLQSKDLFVKFVRSNKMFDSFESFSIMIF